jgi:GTP cyclohydrolase IA
MPDQRRGVNRSAQERAIADLIHALGLDPASEPELDATPARVADFFTEAFSGLETSAAPELQVFPHAGGDDVVVVRGLEFHSMCVHHFAPFFGTALVAYLPDKSLLGISAAARLVEWYSRRPQLQERMTSQIADHLERLVRPRGVAVVLEARHLCMEMRGVRRRGTVETRVVRGALAEPRWAGVLRTEAER